MTTSDPDRNKAPYWRLSAWYFCYFAFVGVFSPYFGLYLQGLGHSAWDISVLLSLMQVMRLLAPNLWGWLADRDGRVLRVARIGSISGTLIFSALFVVSGFEAVFAVADRLPPQFR